MTNRERYANEIKNFKGNFCEDFVKTNILKTQDCIALSCCNCRMLQALWLDEEYVEEIPEVDWSKVAVDTPILVREFEKKRWTKRHFAKYENGMVYAWISGETSWTTSDDSNLLEWKYAKLAEDGEV